MKDRQENREERETGKAAQDDAPRDMAQETWANTVHRREGELVIALAGNPNVGKSTVFNALTGMNQHTGNWPGKTVVTAQGRCTYEGRTLLLVDLPGTYSLHAHSAEEEAACSFLCFGGADAVAVVCDATCLERSLSLVLQTAEITPHVVVCVNLMDEAKKKHIHIDADALSAALGLRVVETSARSGKGLEALLSAVTTEAGQQAAAPVTHAMYAAPVEAAVARLTPLLVPWTRDVFPARFAALRLLEGGGVLCGEMVRFLGDGIRADAALWHAVEEEKQALARHGFGGRALSDHISAAIVRRAEEIGRAAIRCEGKEPHARDRKIDRILTGKKTGVPIMLLLLAFVFFLTITGANVPSQWLSEGFSWLGGHLSALFAALGAPAWLHDVLVEGVYRVLSWVVAVMLPPMAIFFPLFTILEDFGYLPRVAFNLDRYFKKACACGKQALTMCMGFGCNAVGVIGCRIIDSPRERLIAILTNSFVPCNGRFAQPHKGQQKRFCPPGGEEETTAGYEEEAGKKPSYKQAKRVPHKEGFANPYGLLSPSSRRLIFSIM